LKAVGGTLLQLAVAESDSQCRRRQLQSLAIIASLWTRVPVISRAGNRLLSVATWPALQRLYSVVRDYGSMVAILELSGRIVQTLLCSSESTPLHTALDSESMCV
jgi:hypothetical protein